MLTPAISHPAFASASSPVPPRANGELILVVDDQQDIRDLLATVLSDHGYRTLLAVDGDDALVVFKRHANAVAAVITDLNMPLPMSLAWRRDNTSPLLASFIAEVRRFPEVQALNKK